MPDRQPSKPALGAGVGLLALGVGSLVGLDASNNTLRASTTQSTIGAFLIAGFGYALVMVATQSRGIQTLNTLWTFDTPWTLNALWKWLLLLGLVLRLGMVFTEPTLSDDVYRYLWEGHLVTEGVSPYAFTVDSPVGEAYDIPARTLANNRTLASPYLPVAHALFGLTAFLLPSEPWTMQLLMIAFDTLGLIAILQLLKMADLPQQRVLLYWLNPLVILEVAHGAHIDAILVGLGLTGVWLSLRRKPAAASCGLTQVGGAVLVAAATLTKPLALLFMPVLLPRWNWRQRVAWTVTMVGVVGFFGAWSGFGFDNSGTGVFGSARAYTETFRFNSGVYHWLETWIGGRGLDDRGWDEPRSLTRLIVAGTAGTAMLGVFIVSLRQQSPRATLRLLAVPLAVYVLLTPVLHPWYLLVLLAFVPFLAPSEEESLHRWLVPLPWLALSNLVIFSYLTYEDPSAFGEREWIRRLEWFPTLLLVGVAALAARSDWRDSSHARVGPGSV